MLQVGQSTKTSYRTLFLLVVPPAGGDDHRCTPGSRFIVAAGRKNFYAHPYLKRKQKCNSGIVGKKLYLVQ